MASDDADAYPNAAALQNNLLALPTHPYVSERDRQAVVETIQTELAETLVAGPDDEHTDCSVQK